MRRCAVWGILLAAGVTGGAAAFGQTESTIGAPSLGVPLGPVIVTLDQNRFFAESAFGKAVQARAKTADDALAAENQRIYAALEEEERDLTARRPTMSAEDFAQVANAFDTKVEAIRAAQDAKSRDIARRRDMEQKQFGTIAGPVLGALMSDLGAVAIIDKSAIILSLGSFDITAQAVARVDAVLPGGAVPAGDVPGQLPATPDLPAP